MRVKSGPVVKFCLMFGCEALSVPAQKIAAQSGSFQIPSNPGTPVPPEAPDLSKIKLIEYDFAKYGSSTTRKRLLDKWTTEVKNAPK